MKFAPLALTGLIVGCAPAQDSQAQAPKTAVAAPAGSPQLAFPVACVVGQTCEVQNYVDRDPGPGAKDYRCGTETYQAHNGVDIRLLDMAAQAAGVNVLAAAPGRVARLRDGVADISVKAAGAAPVAGQECGNGLVIDHGGGWETQYCHMAKGSLVVKQGEEVTAGQPIGRVGLSGNTEYPHLHMTVRHAGTVVDAFAPNGAPDACDTAAPGTGLWTPQAAKAMSYKPGAVLNAGFTTGAVTMEAIGAGGLAAPNSSSPALVAYVRAINLQGGDIQKLALKAPDGTVIAESAPQPLERSKAEYMLFVGKRKPSEGWKTGTYSATYSVQRGGKTVTSRTFDLRL